jgi:hypothetical protein
MPYLRKSAEKRGFPQILGKAYGFPTFPTGSADIFFTVKMAKSAGSSAYGLSRGGFSQNNMVV